MIDNNDGKKWMIGDKEQEEDEKEKGRERE